MKKNHIIQKGRENEKDEGFSIKNDQKIIITCQKIQNIRFKDTLSDQEWIGTKMRRDSGRETMIRENDGLKPKQNQTLTKCFFFPS